VNIYEKVTVKEYIGHKIEALQKWGHILSLGLDKSATAERELSRLFEAFSHIAEIRSTFYSKYLSSDKFKKEADKIFATDYIAWTSFFAEKYNPLNELTGNPIMEAFIPSQNQIAMLHFVNDMVNDGTGYLIEVEQCDLTSVQVAMSAYDSWCLLYKKDRKGRTFRKGWGARKKELLEEYYKPSASAIREEKQGTVMATIARNLNFVDQERTFERIFLKDFESSVIAEGGENIGRGGKVDHFTLLDAESIDKLHLSLLHLSCTSRCTGLITIGSNHSDLVEYYIANNRLSTFKFGE